ncbi:MAG: alanine racemase [Fluviicola sp.]|nr:alanine racemase [Fluviicola sp.]
MKLAYTIASCSRILHATVVGDSNTTLQHVLYDSRKIHAPENALFFAFHGAKRSGEQFVEDAFSKGVRHFVVTNKLDISSYKDACFLIVNDPLVALQTLAKHHRSQFTYPVIAITGSVGKTTFKEWAFQCLSSSFHIVRSPKSFNSQIGVALSLLEMHADANLALIEAGISEAGEMERLEAMIQPDYGIFTAFGNAHREHFTDANSHLDEKLKLFKNCKLVFASAQLTEIADFLPGNFEICASEIDQRFPKGYAGMLGVLRKLSTFLQVPKELYESRLKSLPILALRMESFDGVFGTTIINDTYNLDKDALVEALNHQLQVAGTRKRAVVLGIAKTHDAQKETLQQIVASFHPDAFVMIGEHEQIDWKQFENMVVLVKANRELNLEHEVARGKAIKHRTVVEINLSAIQHNINLYKNRLPKHVQLLAMVKAASYGSGAERVAPFLEQLGVNYFGVAFADEGVELRKIGILSPIVVMNPDPEHADLIIENRLEPAIYSFEQLDEFIKELISRGLEAYPVHLKFDTGMHRLGFAPNDKEKVLAMINAQPEIRVQGIYSHLADADNEAHQTFTLKQISIFDEIVQYFKQQLSNPFLAHLMNSEGALRYPEHAYDMVRLGISMYGYTENALLKKAFQPAVAWYSAVSQIKTSPAGDTVGYGCTFEADTEMQIAIIPVGYADGFRRSLSNGVGSVYINNQSCSVVGRVCMDMIMVDVTNKNIQANDKVEIIGNNIPMETFAARLQTIPYEVMTSLSKRMHRVYITD